MSHTASVLESSQDAACVMLLRGATCMLPVVVAGSWLAGNGLLLAPALSLAFLAIGVFGRQLDRPTARLGTSLAVIGQAIALTAAFDGHPWQIDMHMAFFAALATLVLLVDVRAILAATGLIVLHHLSLSVLLPGLIYPSVDFYGNIGRTLVHGAIVTVESAALIAAVLIRLRLQGQAEERETALTTARELAASMLTKAETALKQAEAQSILADQLRQAAEAAGHQMKTESDRAESAHQSARAIEAKEAESRAAALLEQQGIVSALRDALAKVSEGDLSVTIGTPFPAEYESLRRDFNALAVTHKLVR